DATIANESQIGIISPCVSSNGSELYASYVLVTGPVNGKYDVAVKASRSNDSGASWTPPITVHDPTHPEPPVVGTVNCAADNDGFWIAYGTGDDPISTDNSSMQRSKNVWVAHARSDLMIDRRVSAADTIGGDRYLNPALIRDATGALQLSYFA